MRHLTFGLLTLMCFTNCAAMRAAQAHDRQLERSVQTFTYQRPCGDVWGAARTMLFGQDYQVKSADAAAGLTLETEWKANPSGDSSRYLFQGNTPTPNSCQVVATKASKSVQGQTAMMRDWRMEWNLIKQVDVAAANDLEREADVAGAAARQQQ